MHNHLEAAKRFPGLALIPWLLFWLLIVFTVPSQAQPNKPEKPSSQIQQSDDLSKTLNQSCISEKQELAQLKEQHDKLRDSKKTLDTEIGAYKVQASAYSNLLHQETPVEDLKKVRADLEAAIQDVAKRLQNLNSSQEEVHKLHEEEKQQYDFNSQQLAKIRKSNSNTQPDRVIADQLQNLNKAISEQLQVTSAMEDIYVKNIAQLEEVKESFDSLAKSYDQQIEERQKQVLFSRKENFLVAVNLKEITADVQKLIDEAHQFYSRDFWAKQLRTIWRSGGILLVKAFLLFVITQILILRLRKFCLHLKERLQAQKHWFCLTLDLFRRSLPLSGTVLFLYAYAQLQDLSSGFPFVSVIINVLLTWLIGRWVLDLIKLIKRSQRLQVPLELLAKIHWIVSTILFFAIPYLVLQWNLGSSSSVLLLARVAFEIYLIVWSLRFWKVFRQTSAESYLTSSRELSTLRIAIIGWGYTAAFGGLILELVGYGQLALYWYVSWGRSVAVIIWGTLLFLVLYEWNRAITSVPVPERKETHHIRWLLVRLLGAAWVGAMAAFLMIAWGARRAIVLGFFRILNQSIRLGEMRFNLLGIAYAFLILAFTLAATRFWRQTLKKRILPDSGLEEGLQESVATLSVYVLWALGILAALHALGVGTTSLAVAFGALGIGLGFGLQNIFNNFISGIILLFERPIQVGEVIEIGGEWGTVSKINFRSTVVQTYNNASLIIPNSDFISNQVVNWSFKDPKLRRSVTVGVAYGSDIELVRDTLLEIADNHPKVLKYPKYDVVFSDFGDSALVFKLRFWSTLNDFFPAETEIRFEIDKLFRERNIEISFPQRDINIRSIVPDVAVNLKGTKERE